MNLSPLCPNCQKTMQVRAMACRACDVRIDAPFPASDIPALTSDMLHFLRVFIHCEGRIKDMEAALGVSYPTVKAHLTQLKDVFFATAKSPANATSPTAGSGESPNRSSDDVITAIEKGDLNVADAIKQLRQRRNPKKGT